MDKLLEDVLTDPDTMMLYFDETHLVFVFREDVLVNLRPGEGDVIQIALVAVRPSKQKTGLAREALRWLCARANQHKIVFAAEAQLLKLAPNADDYFEPHGWVDVAIRRQFNGKYVGEPIGHFLKDRKWRNKLVSDFEFEPVSPLDNKVIRKPR